MFNKYFPDASATTVRKVFKQTIGDDTTPGGAGQRANTCSAELTNIKIVNDFENDKKKFACSAPDVFAALRDNEEDTPKLILCPAAYNHGSINKAYNVGFNPPGPGLTSCDTIGDRVSYRMETLGAILLHEYT